MDLSLCFASTSTNSEEIPSEKCHLCSKRFKNVGLRNRHITRVHKIDVLNPKISYIICPLCEEETDLKSHEGLRKHLGGNHQVGIELMTFEFSGKQEYDTWKDEEKIETNYAMHRSIRKKEHKTLYYDCNRSNHKGYKPNYKTRTEKSGGTIKINGVCPSRLICKLWDEGQVSVSYWQTHAGHEQELRSKHLSKAEEKMVAEKLQSGMPSNRILEDLRKLEAPKLERLAILTSQDLTNLSKKYSIHKKRDQNDMVAAAVKVQEWNANDKNYAFLFKKEDKIANCLGENSIIKQQHEEEINEFIREKVGETNQATDEVQAQSKRSLQWENLQNFVEGLDDKNFTEFMTDIQGTVHKFEGNTNKTTRKRKMEKQEYFPSCKHPKQSKI